MTIEARDFARGDEDRTRVATSAFDAVDGSSTGTEAPHIRVEALAWVKIILFTEC